MDPNMEQKRDILWVRYMKWSKNTLLIFVLELKGMSHNNFSQIVHNVPYMGSPTVAYSYFIRIKIGIISCLEIDTPLFQIRKCILL